MRIVCLDFFLAVLFGHNDPVWRRPRANLGQTEGSKSKFSDKEIDYFQFSPFWTSILCTKYVKITIHCLWSANFKYPIIRKACILKTYTVFESKLYILTWILLILRPKIISISGFKKCIRTCINISSYIILRKKIWNRFWTLLNVIVYKILHQIDFFKNMQQFMFYSVLSNLVLSRIMWV